MSMQLTLDFTSGPQREKQPIIRNGAWLDVSDIARGVGCITAVQVSINLNEALQSLQNEIDSDYDQRLYDALWLAHFKLSLAQSQSVTFNFTFPRKEKNVSEISLRVRVEAQEQIVLLGLPDDLWDGE